MLTCRYLCIAQAACLPSLTDSTVVVATPPRSPPQNTPGSLVAMLSGSTSGRPQSLSFTGDRADTTGGGGGGGGGGHNGCYPQNASHCTVHTYVFLT